MGCWNGPDARWWAEVVGLWEFGANDVRFTSRRVAETQRFY